MKPCTRCDRHVRRAEPECPFCGAALPDVLAPSAVAWSLGLALFACGTGDPPADNDETTTPATSTTGAPDPTTGSTITTSGCSGACTDSNEGTAFIYAAVDIANPFIECDVWAQDCPLGQKCSAYAVGGGTSWNATKCVPVARDPKQPGEPCMVEGSGVSGIDDCDLGALCWDVDVENVGTCVALCKGAPDAPSCDDPATSCAIVNDGVLNLCLPTCDPLAQDCPMSDNVCIGHGPGFLCVPDASGEEGQQHDPCEYTNACDPGLVCIGPSAAVECDANSSGCCEPFCDLTDPDADANCGGQGQVCVPWYGEGTAPPGLENVGICTLPP